MDEQTQHLVLQVIHWLERISNNIHEVGDAVGARMTPPSGDEFGRLQTRVMLLGQERDNLYDQLQEAKAELVKVQPLPQPVQNQITDLESVIVSRDREITRLTERLSAERGWIERLMGTLHQVNLVVGASMNEIKGVRDNKS